MANPVPKPTYRRFKPTARQRGPLHQKYGKNSQNGLKGSVNAAEERPFMQHTLREDGSCNRLRSMT